VVFEIVYGALALPGRRAAGGHAEIAPLACFGFVLRE
jgi:hypothetical protein